MRDALSLCMIVKNEERNLSSCLESVRGLADELIIVDTGSTDRTHRIAATFGAEARKSRSIFTVVDFPRLCPPLCDGTRAWPVDNGARRG